MADFKSMKNSEDSLANIFSSYFGIFTSMNALTNYQFDDVAKIFEKATYKLPIRVALYSNLLSSALVRLQSDDVAKTFEKATYGCLFGWRHTLPWSLSDDVAKTFFEKATYDCRSGWRYALQSDDVAKTFIREGNL